MMVPSRRWLVIAAALAVLAPLGLAGATFTGVWLGVCAAWSLALIVDLGRVRQFNWAALVLDRDAPPALSIGRSLPVRYRWQHPSDATLWVRESSPASIVSEPRDRMIALRADRSTVEDRTLQPRTRGHATGWRFDLRVRSPWGLAWRQTRRDLPWGITVYPRLRTAALAQLPSQSRMRQEAGLRQVRRLGEGRLFESLRDWVPGDEMRTVDWKATARRGRLMARQYEDERRQRVILALDAGRLLTAESDGRARIEDAIEAIAQLASRAAELDDDIGLLVFSDRIDQYVPPVRGRRALRAILDGLAAVEGRLVEPDYPAAFAFLASQTRKRALAIVFTDVIDRFASDAFVSQIGRLRPRHLPVAVTIRDLALERLTATRPTGTDAAFERAAAEQLLQVRADALNELRVRGVVIVDTTPDSAPQAVVECYLTLKRRGLI